MQGDVQQYLTRASIEVARFDVFGSPRRSLTQTCRGAIVVLQINHFNTQATGLFVTMVALSGYYSSYACG